jgi:DNA-binding SARP family transcriptional activator
MSRLITARLLGAPEVSIDGAPVPAELLWRKNLALCLLLWGATEHHRSRDQLIGMLWAEKDEHAARHSLNEALRVIRRAAGEDAIESDGSSVRWVGDVDLDLARFAARERDDPRNAAALVAGPYCDGFSVPGAEGFEQWLETERLAWQPRLVNALVRASVHAANHAELAEALALADRAVRIDPHSEAAARSAVTARWLLGDRGGAVAFGKAFASRIETDLGLALDPQTAELLRRVAHEQRPGVAERGPVAHRSPLFGRDAVLARVLAHLRGAMAAPHPTLVIITGDPGSGRSRLLEEVTNRAMLEGVSVARMRALDADRGQAHALLLGLAVGGVDRAPGVAAAPTGALATLTALLPQWRERFPAASGMTGLPLRDAFAAVLRATADERPVLLAIDDANRLDFESLRDIPVLLRDTPGLPVSCVLVFDRAGTAEADGLRRAAERDFGGLAVRVEPLDLAELEQLVDWGLHDWSPEAKSRLARRLLAESAGAPGIAVELLGAVVHGLEFRDPGTTWPTADRTLDATLPSPMPDPMVAAIRLAFGRLPGEARQLLLAAALLPEPFSAEQVAKAAEHDDPVTRDGSLDALEWERWLVADGRGYSFAAKAVRRLLAEEMLTPGQRRRMVDRIAGQA